MLWVRGDVVEGGAVDIVEEGGHCGGRGRNEGEEML